MSALTRLNHAPSIFLRAVLLAFLLTLIAGGVSVATMLGPVDVDVDGERTRVHTLSSTVGEVLADAGYDVGEADLVEPSADAVVSAGDTVVLRTAKDVELVDAGETRAVSTPHGDVGAFLAAQGVPLREDDEVRPSADTGVTDGMTVTVTRIRTALDTVREPFDPPAEEVEDPRLDEDEVEEAEPGRAGEKQITYRVRTVDGDEAARTVVDEEVLDAGVPTVVRIGTGDSGDSEDSGDSGDSSSSGGSNSSGGSAAPSVPGHTVWDTIAQCEATGDWSIDSGNGFSGGLQFTPGTWRAFGGGEYADQAHRASREEQIAVAEKVKDAQGWGAWPACTGELGLR